MTKLRVTVGTDVRKLVRDGYPVSRVFGCDMRQEFIDLGYKLYGDADICAIQFFSSDIFDVPVCFMPMSFISDRPMTSIMGVLGSLTYIYAGALFHLYDESTQHAIALRLAALIKRESGSIIFGRHRGLEVAGMIDDHLGRCACFNPRYIVRRI